VDGDSNKPTVCWLPFSLDGRSGSSTYRCVLPARELRRLGGSSEIWADGVEREVRRRRPDVAVFQKRYTWEDIRLAESLQDSGTKICFDLCDNHRYALELRGDKDGLRALSTMERLADVMTVPTSRMRGFVRRTGVSVIDDAVEPRRGLSLLRPLWTRGRRLQVLWFGSAGTDAPPFGLVDLAAELPALEEAAAQTPLHLTVLSNDRRLYERYVRTSAFGHSYREWSSDRSAHRLISAADVCLLPVRENPFTVGKSANRAVLSLLLGVPVIATPHPAYIGLEHLLGITGDTASALVEFAEAHRSRARRRSVVDPALERFSPKVVAERWSEVFGAF
jgi:hypothetical protein